MLEDLTPDPEVDEVSEDADTSEEPVNDPVADEPDDGAGEAPAGVQP